MKRTELHAWICFSGMPSQFLLFLGLAALVAENSVQTEGGKHLCTLCGKVLADIRQHIRGC